MIKWIKHKKDHNRLLYIHPLLMLVLADARLWCEENGLPFKITSTVSTLKEDKSLGRISSSHRTGRAADISVHDWDVYSISRFRDFFNEKYKDIAAVSSSNNHPILGVYHNSGHGDHIHIQIHAKYSLNIDWKFLK